MAGRVTLIKSVTSLIPIYAMLTVKLPGTICDQLDKLNRKFLWGYNSDNHLVHLVNWETVNTGDMNRALLAKIGWRLSNTVDSFWAKVLRNKYLCSSTLADSSRRIKGTDLTTWRGICFRVNLLNEGTKWRVGQGDKI